MFVHHNAALPRRRRCFKCAQSQDLEEAGQRGRQDNTLGKSLATASRTTERTPPSLVWVHRSFLGSFMALSVPAASDLRHWAASFLYLSKGGVQLQDLCSAFLPQGARDCLSCAL